ALDVLRRDVPAAPLTLAAGVFVLLLAALRATARTRRLAGLVVATGLLLPLQDAAVRSALARAIGPYLSTEEVARFIQRDPALRACALSCVGGVQLSTAYYTKGRAQGVSEVAGELDGTLPGSCRLVLIKPKYLQRVPRESLAHLTLVRDFGSERLY